MLKSVALIRPKYLSILIFIILYNPTITLSQGVLYPVDNQIVNCTMLRFAWESNGTELNFQLQISTDEGENDFEEIQYNGFISTPATVIRNILEFSNNYLWRTRSIVEGGDTLEWSDTHRFSMITIPDSIIGAIQTEIHHRNQIQSGYTITSSLGTLLGLDQEGEIIWYIPGERRFWIGNMDIRQMPSGEFLSIFERGARLFSPNDETTWHSNQLTDIDFHHDIFPMPSGTFMGLVTGYHWIRNGEDSTQWGMSEITEINRKGEVVWRWNMRTHVSTEDYDTLEFAHVPPNGSYDWDHCNACPFVEEDSTIYLSARNLNRIIKIDYPSGDIIWSMGVPMQTGIVDFGENLGFYRQHAPYPLPNGNLLFFDNNWQLEGDNEFSRAIEIEIDMDREEPAEIIWEYRHEFSLIQGDADRLANGNTLIATGYSKNIYEVNFEEELVWQSRIDLPYGIYRSERISDFYPQVFCIEGPPIGTQLPAGNADVNFTIYNIGSKEGRYKYEFSDTKGWFRGFTQEVAIDAGDSSLINFAGYIPNDEESVDTLMFSVSLVQNDSEIQNWITTINPVPNSTDEEGEIDVSEFEISLSGGLMDSKRLSFKLPVASRTQIFLFDQLGRRIQSVFDSWLNRGVHNIELDINGLSAGVYYIDFRTKGQVISKSFIILK